MTDLELACLRVIRIEGPIGSNDLAVRMCTSQMKSEQAAEQLKLRGYLFCLPGHYYDVTPRGRVKFSAMHRPSKKDITARLKARAGWKGAKG